MYLFVFAFLFEKQTLAFDDKINLKENKNENKLVEEKKNWAG